MKEGLAAQFRGADAESMVTSFRKMLRGLSDAELLLDEPLTMRISNISFPVAVYTNFFIFRGLAVKNVTLECYRTAQATRDLETSCFHDGAEFWFVYVSASIASLQQPDLSS